MNDENTPLKPSDAIRQYTRRQFLKFAAAMPIYVFVASGLKFERTLADMQMLKMHVDAIKGFGGRLMRARSISRFANENLIPEEYFLVPEKNFRPMHPSFHNQPYKQIIQNEILMPQKGSESSNRLLYQVDPEKLNAADELLTREIRKLTGK